MVNDIRGKVYHNYRKLFLNGLKNRRGATRLSNFLRRHAENSLEPAPPADDIFDYEWDNLVIIDACRHDLYEEVFGEADKRITKGSCTPEFISRNFSKDLDDIVYISANPFLTPEYMEELTGRANPFHKVYRTYQHGWDSGSKTIPPEEIVNDAIKAEKEFPTKRKIIHFMQPHHPFIKSEMGGTEPRLPHKDNEEANVWERLEKGELSQKEVWGAYKNNLELLEPSITKLKEQIEGKTILTSDHGNLIGENGIYGHPKNCDVKALKEVPIRVLKGDKKSESRQIMDELDI